MINQNLNYSGGEMVWISAHWPIFSLLVLWSLFWAGLAIWHSVRRGQYWWFIIFLLVHTFGILEIIYLFGVLKLKFSNLFSK